MKDFYDILFFANNYEFKKDKLKEALNVTFNQRGTDVELHKKIFEDKFKTNQQLQKYWAAFLERSNLLAERSFAEAVAKIHSFIEPIFDFGSAGKNNWDNKDWEWK